jgi:myo-inositol-1(or 4)-monophosphatase
MKNKKVRTKTIDLSLVLKDMINWSFECGKIINNHLIESYEKPIKVLNKGKQGVATEADIQSEEYVMNEIKKKYPDHKILSEEDSFAKNIKMKDFSDDEYLWLIDPLDGTNNFYNRVPFFCVSLALNKGKTTLVGVVYNPVTCELFYAIKNRGAYLVRMVGNQEIRLKLKRKKNKKLLKEALLSANLTSKRIEKDLLKEFPEVRAMRRFGSAALEMSYVAAGMLDAYWEHHLKPWDMAAAGLICQESGVKISTIRGDKYHPFCGPVLCAEPSIYDSLLCVLNRD